ncbi:hypothetical protein JTE90_006854 [Oedothorax gibbosus]|uniref:PX domain-containing protein n=1 Tax=Oedothorax gibbosus TaxID=931172 RepID=A0AAV6TV19_9ARAC|nr:hypothetical protein JTE90_006854 [Oedothorax gibbosus]
MLEPIDGANDQNFIKINISSRIEPYASYVTYEIKIETNDPSFSFQESTVNRRYSDFHTLHSILAKQFVFTKPPSLPPKAPFKRTFDLDFVEKRRKALEEFLAKMLSKKIYLASRAFHLFLQTNYTMSEIQNMVENNIPETSANGEVVIHKSLSPLKDETINQDNFNNSEETEKTGSSSNKKRPRTSPLSQPYGPYNAAEGPPATQKNPCTQYKRGPVHSSATPHAQVTQVCELLTTNLTSMRLLSRVGQPMLPQIAEMGRSGYAA